MPRHRRRYRRAVAIPRPKYSAETLALNFALQNDGTAQNYNASIAVALIPPITAFGRRKCKYFTLRIRALGTLLNNIRQEVSLVHFVIVFVPEGTAAGPIRNSVPASLASMYEPNQNVIMQGEIDDKQVYTFRSRLSRNLNSNDSVYIVARDIATNGQQPVTIETAVSMTFNYAITF